MLRVGISCSRGEATTTEVSQVIANPSNTVLQGTMIEATLENASIRVYPARSPRS